MLLLHICITNTNFNIFWLSKRINLTFLSLYKTILWPWNWIKCQKSWPMFLKGVTRELLSTKRQNTCRIFKNRSSIKSTICEPYEETRPLKDLNRSRPSIKRNFSFSGILLQLVKSTSSKCICTDQSWFPAFLLMVVCIFCTRGCFPRSCNQVL